MNTIEEIDLILSIVAIMVSIVVAIKEYRLEKRNNAISLESDICFKIYYDYLVTIIPNAREYILYNDSKLSGTDRLTNALNEVRKSSLFFKYRDKNYYEKLVKELQELEDYLIKSEGEMNYEEFSIFVQEVNSKIEEIYKTIMEECSGMRNR